MKLSLKQPNIAGLGQVRGWASVFFSDATLALAAVRPGAGKPTTEKESSVSAAAQTEGETEQARWARTAQALSAQADVREHRLVTAVACEEVLCQTLRLPTTEPGELRQMLELQIDNLTPLPPEEIVYGFTPLETSNGETRVLVAVAPKAAVNKRVAPLEAAKLPVEIVVVDALAVFGAFRRQNLLPADEHLQAFVQLTATAAHIIVHQRGQPVTVRSVLLDGAAVGGTEQCAALRDELQRTLVAAEAELPGTAVGQLTFVTWDENLRPGLAQVAQGWNGQAQCLDPASGPSPALSLCLEAVAEEKAAVRLNLLPDEWPQRRRKARMRRLLIRSAIAGVAVYVLALVAFFAFMGVKQVALNKLEADVRGRQGRYDQARAVHGELIAIQKQLDSKYSALEVMREVSVLMPENMKLDTFTFKKDQSVTLRGQSAAATTATDFISRLEKCPLFSGVKTVSMPTVGGLTKFEVLCTLKSAAPGTAGIAGIRR